MIVRKQWAAIITNATRHGLQEDDIVTEQTILPIYTIYRFDNNKSGTQWLENSPSAIS